jgi:hypothetical protein
MLHFPTPAEINAFRQSTAADRPTLELLEQTQDFEAAFEQIYRDRFGTVPTFDATQPSLWKILLQRIRQEICGDDDSLRSLIQSAKKNPDNATLITGVIRHWSISPAFPCRSIPPLPQPLRSTFSISVSMSFANGLLLPQPRNVAPENSNFVSENLSFVLANSNFAPENLSSALANSNFAPKNLTLHLKT